MIAPNAGILASADILALDRATADIAGFKNIYEDMFAYAQKAGLGNLEYKLHKLL